jgi:hypothetical protein
MYWEGVVMVMAMNLGVIMILVRNLSMVLSCDG